MKDGSERLVFQTLATSEDALHVAELARRTGLSRVTVYKALASLTKEGTVTRSERVGPMPRYAVNPEHAAVKRLRGDAGAGARDAVAGKLLVVEVDTEKPQVSLRTDRARGVGLEVWVTTLEEARALGKLQKAIERLGLEEVANRAYES